MGFPWKRVFIALAALACLMVAACHEQEPIRIGFYGGLTGRAAGLGTSGRDGFLLAIEQANAGGGINGRRIEPVISDNRMEQGTATATLKELIGRKVVAVIGPMTSQIAVTVVPVANSAGVPMISPTVSTNQLSGLEDYFLRVYYSNAQAAALLAQHLAKQQPKPRIIAIYDLGNRAYTEDWLRDFKARYQQSGGQLIEAIPFEIKGDTLFGKLAEQALAAKPDGILLLANSIDSAMLAQQLHKRGDSIPLYATGWSYTDDLVQFGGNSVEGLTIIQSANPESALPECQAFRKAYLDRYRQPPGFPALHAYDATRMLLAALKTAENGEALRQALLALPVQNGAQGRIAFDRFGDLRDPELHLAVIEHGAFRPVP
jgi:branched-chain amino acid transport system substrate-binding protein